MIACNMTPPLSIIVYASVPGLRIERLLWSLALNRPTPHYDLFVLDLTETGDPGLEEQLRKYSSSIGWTLLRPTGEIPLGELVQGECVISLPASAIPFENALADLLAYTSAQGTCRNPGPICVYGMDHLGSNLTPDMVYNSPINEDVFVWAETRQRWHWPAEQMRPVALPKLDFILYPPVEHYSPRPDQLVSIVACSSLRPAS